MSGLYLPVRTKGSAAIAICTRCGFKMYYADLKKDPNSNNFYCKDCVDIYDPWRLPARRAEDISLPHPRPDEELV
jgi:RNase P subunit RPR2